MIHCSIRINIFMSELTNYLCLLAKIYALKIFIFQSILMMAYFDPCFWSKNLENKLKVQNTNAEQLTCKTVVAELVLLLKTSRWLLLDTVWEGLFFNCLSYLIFEILNNIQILVITSTYGFQSSSLESDITSKSAKSKNCS